MKLGLLLTYKKEPAEMKVLLLFVNLLLIHKYEKKKYQTMKQNLKQLMFEEEMYKFRLHNLANCLNYEFEM
jgi:hypothetical protein